MLLRGDGAVLQAPQPAHRLGGAAGGDPRLLRGAAGRARRAGPGDQARAPAARPGRRPARWCSAVTCRASSPTTAPAARSSRRSWSRTRHRRACSSCARASSRCARWSTRCSSWRRARTALFHEVGNLVLRTIVHNQYFRPFRPLEFCLEFDRVKSVPVLDALRKLGDPERRLFTTVALGLFRLLHYLTYVRVDAARGRARARVVLALVRSEALTLVGLLSGRSSRPASTSAHRAARFRRPRARAGPRDVPSCSGDGPGGRPSGGRAHRAPARQPPSRPRALPGSTRASSDSSRRRHGRAAPHGPRVFAELARAADDGCARAPRRATARCGRSAVRRDFQDVGYQLLRYGDFEPFDRFTGLVLELDPDKAGPEIATGSPRTVSASPTSPRRPSRRSAAAPSWAARTLRPPHGPRRGAPPMSAG